MTVRPEKSGRPIVLAAGGTGGHMFPAEALARALLARGRRVTLVTDVRGKAFGDALPDVTVHRIRSSTIAGGVLGRVRGVADLALGTLAARRLLKRIDPAVVIGFGGYPSVPTVYAAQHLGLPVALHEQNAVLGRANRLLAGRARTIAVSFPTVTGLPAHGDAPVVRTGNPVRPEILAVRGLPYPPIDTDGPVRLLVMGGSQGARIFSDVVPAALARLPAPVKARIRVSQQCRPEDIGAARQAFADAGIDAEVSTFFRDVPERLASCHLAITRAGASTVSELTVAGRPAVLVPYPHATDDHQTANARAIADCGGAWLMPQPTFTPEALAARIEALLCLPTTLSAAAAAARGWGMTEAASNLADTVLALACESESNGPEGNGTGERSDTSIMTGEAAE